MLACVVVTALASGITQAAWFSFVAQLVPREDMLNAVRLNVLQFQVARAIGPGLAGLVLATLGAGAAFFANGVSFLIVLAALPVIPARPVLSVAATRAWAHFWDGVRYVRERRVLAAATLTALVMAFLGQSVIQVIEPFTRRVLHVGAGPYGVLAGVYGVGSVLGALVIVFGEHWRPSRVFVVTAAVLVGAQVAFGFAPSYAFALAAIIVAGSTWTMSTVTLQTSVQANVNETHRGRVTAIYFMAITLGVPSGALIAGVTGDLIGLRATFVSAAVAILLYLIYANLHFARFRLLDQSIEHTERIRTESHPLRWADPRRPLRSP